MSNGKELIIFMSNGEELTSQENRQLVYSDILYRPEVSIKCQEAVIIQTGKLSLNALLARLPATTSRTVTPEAAYHSNVDVFVKSWLKKSDTLTLLAHRTRFTQNPYLPEEAAVDILADMDIIPAESRNIGKIILQNSEAGRTDKAKDLQSSKGWLYDIASASKKGIPGFILRRYQRGLY